MPMSRHCATLCLVALALSCTKEQRTDPASPTVTGVPLPTVMTVCGYVQAGVDTLEIIAPEQLMCDSAGAPQPWPLDTVRSWFWAEGDSLKVDLADVSPIVRRILAGPSFGPEVAGFLDVLQSAHGFVTVKGVFVRMEGDSGTQGLWRFAGIEPREFAEILQGGMATTYLSMIVDPDTKAAMLFEFGADTLRGILSRHTYGDAVLREALDTAAYDVSATFLGDSTWRVSGGVSGDEIGMVADSIGDLYWSWNDSDYVYRQFPTQCPNPVLPPWLGPVLEANAR